MFLLLETCLVSLKKTVFQQRLEAFFSFVLARFGKTIRWKVVPTDIQGGRKSSGKVVPLCRVSRKRFSSWFQESTTEHWACCRLALDVFYPSLDDNGDGGEHKVWAGLGLNTVREAFSWGRTTISTYEQGKVCFPGYGTFKPLYVHDSIKTTWSQWYCEIDNAKRRQLNLEETFLATDEAGIRPAEMRKISGYLKLFFITERRTNEKWIFVD